MLWLDDAFLGHQVIDELASAAEGQIGLDLEDERKSIELLGGVHVDWDGGTLVVGGIKGEAGFDVLAVDGEEHEFLTVRGEGIARDGDTVVHAVGFDVVAEVIVFMT